MPKLDRRKRRSRQLLAQALHDLILEKPYDTITIQDITDQADLNRGTFYLHYTSKEKLLMASLEAQFDDLVQRIEAKQEGTPSWQNAEAVRIIFDYAAENAPLFKVLLGQQGQGHVMYRILNYIAEQDELEMRTAFPQDNSPIPIAILARHQAGSLFSLVTWWLENDMPYSSTYMAETLTTLCIGGLETIGLEEVGGNHETSIH